MSQMLPYLDNVPIFAPVEIKNFHVANERLHKYNAHRIVLIPHTASLWRHPKGASILYGSFFAYKIRAYVAFYSKFKKTSDI